MYCRKALRLTSNLQSLTFSSSSTLEQCHNFPYPLKMPLLRRKILFNMLFQDNHSLIKTNNDKAGDNGISRIAPGVAAVAQCVKLLPAMTTFHTSIDVPGKAVGGKGENQAFDPKIIFFKKTYTHKIP